MLLPRNVSHAVGQLVRCESRRGFAGNADTSPPSIEPKEMQVFHNVGRKAVRAAASVIVLGLLGSLAGCGGGGGGGDATTPPPDNIPTLQSIEITPSLTKAAAGTTAQFTATGVYTDNSTEDLTAQATWASSNSAVAMVSNAAGSKGVATTTGVGSATVSATSGAVSGNATLTVTPAPLTVDQMVAALLTAVTGVGPGNSLRNKLTEVQAALAVPNIALACSKLDDFKNQLSVLNEPPVPVAQLTADANAIKAAIPCP